MKMKIDRSVSLLPLALSDTNCLLRTLSPDHAVLNVCEDDDPDLIRIFPPYPKFQVLATSFPALDPGVLDLSLV